MANNNGETNDHQYDGNNGPPVDDMEHDYESEGDSDGSDGPARDAGVDPEAQATKADRKKFKLQEVKKIEDKEAAIHGIRASETDIVKRAKAMKSLLAFEWPVVETKTVAQMQVIKAVSCDQNRMYALDVIYGPKDYPGRPHIDTFRGRFIDHLGNLVDDRYSMAPIIEAMRAAGLEAQPIDGVRKAFKEWAMQVQTNDLIMSFEGRVPEWDGVTRLETRIIELFECFDTDANRAVGKYFWLSLYNRIMNPGCLAPIVISLFGAQKAGKSRFSDAICQIVMRNPKAQAVQLDLGGADRMEFLREMTGNAIIANVGEMTGFTRGDLNKTKAFVTRTSDNMHYKYEGHFEQLRQWVTVMDGNKYEGMQRDDTGNRRFYPFFVGQLPDKEGKPHWRDVFEADFDDFEEQFWQIMAECRAWMGEHGEYGYKKLVSETSSIVFAFSAEEMRRDRGTIRDDKLDAFLVPALRICEMHELKGTKLRGVGISVAEISNRIAQVSRNRCDVNFPHLVNKMNSLGASKEFTPKLRNFYMFRDVTVKELREKLEGGGKTTLDGEEVTVDVWVSPKDNEGDF